jgi:hypothetical protein
MKTLKKNIGYNSYGSYICECTPHCFMQMLTDNNYYHINNFRKKNQRLILKWNSNEKYYYIIINLSIISKRV